MALKQCVRHINTLIEGNKGEERFLVASENIKHKVSCYLVRGSSCTQWAAVTSHCGLMMDAPHTWPAPLTWRLTCQGNSPSCVFSPPTIRDVLNKLLPQSATKTIKESRGRLLQRVVAPEVGSSHPFCRASLTMQMAIIIKHAPAGCFIGTYRSSPRQIRLRSPVSHRILGSPYQCIYCFYIYK